MVLCGRQIDAAPPPDQKMTLEGLLRFFTRQRHLAREVCAGFEAGAFGYHLHHKHTAMGLTNYVVHPKDWDERGKG